MIEQWPSERLPKDQRISADPSFKNVQDFLDILNTFPNGLPQYFDDLIIWIVEQGGDFAELMKRIDEIVNTSNLEISDSKTILSVISCAAALARFPSLQTWSNVNKSNSWQLENWLDEAMMAYATFHPPARDAYVRLAKEVFTALENFTLKSTSERINKERFNEWENWKESKDKLKKIWNDVLAWGNLMNHEKELPLFRVLYKLEPDEFINTISKSNNPYLVNSLLHAAGIGRFSPRFSGWKQMIVKAPVAFGDDGKWNGSIFMPLLLVDAHNQLLQVRDSYGINYSPGDLDAIKQEITSTAELVVATLAGRKDALAIFARWIPWLMREIFIETQKDTRDVNSRALSDYALIEAIGRSLKGNTLPQKSPDDAPLWEAWCYRCVLAFLADNEYHETPDWESFRDEWNLSLEDWSKEKGHLLREHASLIITHNKEIPDLAAKLLAYPIEKSSTPVDVWIDLWNKTISLREIVEFGDTDKSKDEYTSRVEAGRLLFLLFRIGLAIFDRGAAICSNNNSPKAESLSLLFKKLYFATCEMREIDNTFTHDEWLTAIQHLVVRRMIWESDPEDESSSGNFKVFKANDTPTVSDFFNDAKSDVIKLVEILKSILLNRPNITILKTHLNSASINLSTILFTIKKLNQYNPRKYPISEVQLQRLSDMIDEKKQT